MGSQRIIGLVIAVAVVAGGMLFIRQKASNPKTLRVCAWSHYFPDEVLAEFTKKTGIPVELSFISSNEELFAKMRAGATGFDIIQPSDYMIRQMIRLEMLSPLTQSSLPNLAHLEEYFRNLPYDPGLKYSVPFNAGTTGIAINTEKVKVPTDGVSWNMLFNSPNPQHTSLLDDMREVFTGILLLQGKPVNTVDETILRAAKSDIQKVKSKILMFSSEPLPLLTKEEVYIAHAFSEDAIQARVNNPKIQYYIPKEGATRWTDNFAIPKSADHVADAHVFINYFLDPDQALKMILEEHLALPNATAKAKLPPEIRNDANRFPTPEISKRLYFLDDIGDTMTVLTRMWTELKS
jgi:spermidine/putrescine transport system substrate-binding protein